MSTSNFLSKLLIQKYAMINEYARHNDKGSINHFLSGSINSVRDHFRWSYSIYFQNQVDLIFVERKASDSPQSI